MVGYAITDLSDAELKAATTGIIFKVSVICGCQLPTHDFHINALESEFIIFLNQNGYEMLTVEEILTAFRMNANFQLQDKIETYAAIFNIDFASKVLSQYVGKRYKLDHKLSTIDREMETKKILDEQENKRRLKVITQYDKYLQDDNAELDLSDCFMQLVHDGAFLDHKIDKNFMKQAIGETDRMFDNDFTKRMILAGIDIEAGFTAGKLAVKYLFLNMKKKGIDKVYNESMQLLHPGFDMPEEKLDKYDY
tara:strand:- start:246 stop:998 length:753 start_codon:yes stop_codon:yes gene_type:complete